MNKDYDTVLCKVYFHYENIPVHLQDAAKKAFIKARNICAPIFNEHIGDVNERWDLTGQPAAYGPYLEDINPNYVAMISECIQPLFDDALKPLSKDQVRIKFDNYGDLIGYIPEINESKIWADLEPLTN